MERIVYRKTLDVHKNGVQFTLQGFETADNLSRRIEINLMACGDAIDFPLEGVVAEMYVTTPSAATPDIHPCTIEGNKVVYDVLPITEEGITGMQLKLIETSIEGAKSVLAAPKFAVEVIRSNITDDEVVQTERFTALEDAVAKAEATYNERLLRVDVDETCTFRAFYADGAVYETDALRECLLHGNATLSKSYAVGDTGIRENENTDNSKYYSNVSRSSAEEARIAGENATVLLNEARKHGVYTAFGMNFDTGELFYDSPSYSFNVDKETGDLSAEGRGYPVVDGTTVDSKASAGRVLIKSRGVWDADTTYEMLDLVNHKGYAWLAKATVVGIEPSDHYPGVWHNLLDMQTIVKETMAHTMKDDVGALLKDEFSHMLSEALYVEDLRADFEAATFVQWDENTENTPYKAGITDDRKGFAVVFGSKTNNHTIVSWTVGAGQTDCYVRSMNNGEDTGWESSLRTYLAKAGGTMTGPIGLGAGKGAVYADGEATVLKSNGDDDLHAALKITNPDSPTMKVEDIVSLQLGDGDIVKDYRLHGAHNLPLPAQIKYGTYIGDGGYGIDHPTVFTADFDIKLVMVYQENLGAMFGDYDSSSTSGNNKENFFRIIPKGAISMFGTGVGGDLSWTSKLGASWETDSVNGTSKVKLYDKSVNGSDYTGNGYAAKAQMNGDGLTYHYLLIG